MKSLIIYGDSILKGVIYNADSKQTYKLAKSSIKNELSEYGFSVKNNSKMGATVEYGLNCIRKTLIDRCDKDTIVLLEYGGNDCDHNWKEVSANPMGSFYPNVCEKTFVENYISAIEYAKEKGATVVMTTLVPINAQKFMQWISKGLSYDNILSWLGDVSMLSRWQERYNTLVMKIAHMTNCPIIDIRKDFLLAHDYQELICEDGIHPTELGHERINRTVCNYILNMDNAVRAS